MDAAELETNVLSFLHKAFMFARLTQCEGRDVAVFQRRETESESRFRPRIVRLSVVVPTDWIVHDLASDELLLARDGHRPGPREGGTALEAGQEAEEFDEQGIRFHRAPTPQGWAYLPTELGEAARRPEALRALGIEA